ncbi:GyrI-like domain-containing protein [Enteractinococcus helveticum]|uniref:GyrI-like small molecule binding domain-containing protein n=1 Tax=Enteractinococcus helveticum TaxID=1837282 RepID=A0A1B7M0S9_9MICC|nr:GyrI-like domain-containing protein [Enteractinococcus helveticum]OAV61815.1 hypothetical protein A6F49_07940 [Enteractinococcus helveticum]
MIEKIDFKKTLDAYRAKRGEFRLVDVPTMQYLMVDGQGDPNASPEYAQAPEALYPVAYKMKFISKRELGRDYVVPPLEGLWWADDMSAFTSARDKSKWQWTVMIMAPEWIEAAVFESALAQAGAKNPPALLGDVRLETLAEGRCVQTLHVGSYDDEGPVLEQMHQEFIPTHGLQLTGKHHEVYFSDPRKTAPEKLRTLLRQPVTDDAAES